MQMQTTAQTVANTILEQLGGARFSTMTGASRFVTAGDNGRHGLHFRIPRAKQGINCVTVWLEADDTYTVEFRKIGRAPHFTVTDVASVEMVHACSLRGVFETYTGLYTSLGTMVRADMMKVAR